MVTLPMELQGDPLSYENVVNALGLAVSSNQQQVKDGTQKLQQWQKQGMYHSFLQV